MQKRPGLTGFWADRGILGKGPPWRVVVGVFPCETGFAAESQQLARMREAALSATGKDLDNRSCRKMSGS